MNMCVQVLCDCVFILLDVYLRVALLGHMALGVQLFEKPPRLFSKAAAPFHIPTSIARGSSFCVSSPTLVITVLSDDSGTGGGEVASHCASDLHFPGGLIVRCYTELIIYAS